MFKYPGVRMWHAAYDYVRLTRKRQYGEENTCVLYRAAARSCVARELEGQIEMRPWYWQGYSGEIGPGAGHGGREDGFIFQASGGAANDAREMGLWYDGVPRCDVAVTVWYEQDSYQAIRHHAEVSRRFSASKGNTGWRVTHIDGGEYGTTTYLGSRTSDRYIRIYDKQRESEGDKDYENAIRYEVEYKRDAAAQVWAAEAKQAPGREYLAGLVWLELRQKGVFLPRLQGDVVAASPPTAKRQTSTDKRLAWLASQVRPSIEKLLTDGVRKDTILSVLGF